MLVALVVNLAVVGIPALSVYYLRSMISVPLLLVIWTVLYALGVLLVRRLLRGWGVGAFEKLAV